MSRPDVVTLVCGGWSAGKHLSKAEGLVIAVNDAAFHVRCDIALSMDRLWSEHRWDDLKTRNSATWLRRSAVQNIRERPGWLTVFECDEKSTVFTDEPDHLNGTHSGFCALNLAYRLRPHRLIVMGLDMKKGPQGQQHFYPPYPWVKPGGGTTGGKYKAWAAQFEDASVKFKAASIAVTVLGDTAIPAFARSA